MVNVGFTRTTDQIINKIKKLKKEFRDNKKETSKSGSQWSSKSINLDVMDAALERLPSSQFTEALNSATAMLETNTESLSSAADLSKFSLSSFFVVLFSTQFCYPHMFDMIIM